MFDTFSFSRINVNDKLSLNAVRVFLTDFDLSIDKDVEWFVVAYFHSEIIACGGIAGNILKSIAIAPMYQGVGLSIKLMSELTNFSYELGRFKLFLFTKPQNVVLFNQSGFYPISQVDDKLVLLENSRNGLSSYCKSLNKYKISGEKIGCIVMNANPFTLGHQYLVEYAASQCDWLHIILVKENSSEFSYDDRLNMVKLGTVEIKNITIHKGTEYVISKATFPTYFIKSQGLINYCHAAIDLNIFKHHVASSLGITHRFVGTEPSCIVTNNYNQVMKELLPKSDEGKVEVIEIPRKHLCGIPISASRVRSALHKSNFHYLEKTLPKTSLNYIMKMKKYQMDDTHKKEAVAAA